MIQQFIKFVKRLLLALLLAVVAFLTLALTSGGEKFRWFGNSVKGLTDDIAETADLLNEATRNIKSATHTIKKTGGKIKEVASNTAEKASAIVNATGEIVNGVSESASELVKKDDKEDDRDQRPQ